MTRHEYFVQCTKYQLLKLIRETPQDDLNRCTHLNIIQFLSYFIYSIINIGYEPADLTAHPPPNCRGWVHFFRIGV